MQEVCSQPARPGRRASCIVLKPAHVKLKVKCTVANTEKKVLAIAPKPQQVCLYEINIQELSNYSFIEYAGFLV